MSIPDDTASPRRYPDPDDGNLRVTLSPDVRKSLAELPRKEVAASIRSPRAGKDSVAPSTISRIIHGRSSPTRRVAAKIASLLRRDPLEVVAGLEKPYPISEWGPKVIYKRGGFRNSVLRLFRALSPFLDANVHFEVPTDAERPFRRVILSARAEYEYQSFRIDLPDGWRELEKLDFVLSNRILSSPGLVFDYGILEVERDALRAYEIWTRRYQVIPIPPDVETIRVEVWNDGDERPTVIRSGSEFELGSMPHQVATDESRAARMVPLGGIRQVTAPVVRFPAAGVQTRAPYLRIELVDRD